MSDERDARDAWADVVETQRGIFGGAEAAISGKSAMEDWVSARTTPMAKGLKILFQCESCGHRLELVAEYPELIAIRAGLQPHVAFPPGTRVLIHPTVWGFDRDQNAWFPDVKCPCGMPLRTFISVAEASAALVKAQDSAWISGQVVQQLSQHCARQRQGG